ncbi:MAG: hypothetical protein IPP72_10465 [Chitinophagaceae bacterium]|nr:hypothetical protein [Chitinophagaceae bacterium]
MLHLIHIESFFLCIGCSFSIGKGSTGPRGFIPFLLGTESFFFSICSGWVGFGGAVGGVCPVGFVVGLGFTFALCAWQNQHLKAPAALKGTVS